MRSVTNKTGKSYLSLDGELQSSGSVPYALIAGKRQQVNSTSGFEGRYWSTRLALAVSETSSEFAHFMSSTLASCFRYAYRIPHLSGP